MNIIPNVNWSPLELSLLVGHNGAGKTRLLRQMSPSSLYDGRSMYELLEERLSSWRTEDPYKWDWVMRHAKLAFPKCPFDKVEESILLGERMYPAGVLNGLANLTAVIDTPHYSNMAIDDFGDRLDPHATMQILQAMQDLADVDAHSLAVVLATNSIAALDYFSKAGLHDQVYLLKEEWSEPVCVTSIHSPEWLAQASLATLYMQGRL